jgi:predicted secreted protein
MADAAAADAAADVVSQARDAAYTAIGFGVLAYQRLQVRRRELTREVGGKEGVARLVHKVEETVDPVLDGVERRLPQQARSVLHQARTAGKTIERVLLS